MKVTCKTSPKATRGEGLTLTWGQHPFLDGTMLIAMEGGTLVWLGLNCGPAVFKKNWPGAKFVKGEKVTQKVAQEVNKLWPGDFKKMSVPVTLYGTDFQIKVWKELLKIKSGKTVTYQDIARKIGNPAASRAVGSAVGKNTISVIVPCHRVVNANSDTVNYAWGAGLKKNLLKKEGAG